jgi:general secretion pathway protein L
MEYLIVHLHERVVTAARFDISGRSAALCGAASFMIEEEAGLAGVAEQIASGIIGSPRIVLCLSPAMFAQRVVALPFSDLRKIREVLPAHLQGEIALPAEEVVFDAVPAAEGQVLALWAKRVEIAAAVDVFRQSGCEPQIVTSAPFVWQHLPGIPSDCAVCDGTALAIFTAGRLSFVRVLDGADLKRQLHSTLAAVQLGGTQLPSRLFLFGQLIDAASDMTSLPLEMERLKMPDDQATIFRTEEVFQQLASLYAVARACHSGGLPDFRRGDLAWKTGAARLRKKVLLSVVLAVATVALLFISKGLQYRAASTDIASLNASISSIYREIFPSRTKAVDELAEVKGEIRKLSSTERSSSVLDVLRMLAEARGATINGIFEAELEGRTLRLKGDARSTQAVNEFRAALAGIMTMADVGEIKSRPDGTVSFSLSATIKEAAQ